MKISWSENGTRAAPIKFAKELFLDVLFNLQHNKIERKKSVQNEHRMNHAKV